MDIVVDFVVFVDGFGRRPAFGFPLKLFSLQVECPSTCEVGFNDRIC